jgi:hypothetical protein
MFKMLQHCTALAKLGCSQIPVGPARTRYHGCIHLECQQHGLQATPQQRADKAMRGPVDSQEVLTGHTQAQLPGTPFPRCGRRFAAPLSSWRELKLTPQQDKSARRALPCLGRITCLWSAIDSSRRQGGRYPPTFAAMPFGDKVASLLPPSCRQRGLLLLPTAGCTGTRCRAHSICRETLRRARP